MPVPSLVDLDLAASSDDFTIEELECFAVESADRSWSLVDPGHDIERQFDLSRYWRNPTSGCQDHDVADDTQLKAFFISPIGEDGTETRTKADQALTHLVRKALEPIQMKVERADEDLDPGSITRRMLSAIMTANLVVIDLTDHNPNVFYEMAIAHGYKRPCVHVITEGQKVPFDVYDIRTVEYTLSDPDKLNAAVIKLRAYAEKALKDGTTTTPLSGTATFNAIQSSSDPGLELLADVTTQIDRIEQSMRRSPGESSPGLELLADVTTRIDRIEQSMRRSPGESSPGSFQSTIGRGGGSPPEEAPQVVYGRRPENPRHIQSNEPQPIKEDDRRWPQRHPDPSRREITAGSWYAWPSTHIGHELIAAGMMILAGGGRGLPLDYDELERWTRVGFERGMAMRRGER